MSYKALNYGAASVYSATAFVIVDTEVTFTFQFVLIENVNL